MPRAKKEQTPKADKKVEKDSVTVTWRGKSRVYSQDLHGDDFDKLAKEFASKVDGEVA